MFTVSFHFSSKLAASTGNGPCMFVYNIESTSTNTCMILNEASSGLPRPVITLCPLSERSVQYRMLNPVTLVTHGGDE